MTFDRAIYWENRHAGKRGQGEEVKSFTRRHPFMNRAERREDERETRGEIVFTSRTGMTRYRTRQAIARFNRTAHRIAKRRAKRRA